MTESFTGKVLGSTACEHQSSLVVPRTVWVTGDREKTCDDIRFPNIFLFESIHDIGVKSAYSKQEMAIAYSWARMQHS